jgi:hypothetical protein
MRESNFVKLNFVIDETSLAASLVFCHASALLDYPMISEFQKQMRVACKEECSLIAPLPGITYDPALAVFWYMVQEPYRQCFERLLCEAKKTVQYPILLAQTKQRLSECKDQWNENYKQTFAFMKEITGLQFHHSFTIYITHPAMPTGANIGNQRICWGGKEPKKNWTTVYLWHEILHSFLLDPTYLNHAIIEIVTDVELRHLINGVNDSDWKGHEECRELKRLIAPDWKKYLSSPEKNILKFYQTLSKKYPAERYPEEPSP